MRQLLRGMELRTYKSDTASNNAQLSERFQYEILTVDDACWFLVNNFNGG